jgi:hypothetical protein
MSSPYPRMVDLADRIGISIKNYKTMEKFSDRLPSRERLERIIRCGHFNEKTANNLRRAWQTAIAERHGISIAGKAVDIDSLILKIEKEAKQLFQQCRTPMSQMAFQVFHRRLELLLRATLEES